MCAYEDKCVFDFMTKMPGKRTNSSSVDDGAGNLTSHQRARVRTFAFIYELPDVRWALTHLRPFSSMG